MYKSNFYRRNLPHWQPPNAEYFFTFRLTGSLPNEVVNQLKKEQKLINNEELNLTESDGLRKIVKKKYKGLLDSGNVGPTWLADSDIAVIVVEALHHRDQNDYDLYAFCIMSNHVHVVFKLLHNTEAQFPVTEIFKRLKFFTALKANEELGRTGLFWHSKSYDRVIRNEKELEKKFDMC